MIGTIPPSSSSNTSSVMLTTPQKNKENSTKTSSFGDGEPESMETDIFEGHDDIGALFAISDNEKEPRNSFPTTTEKKLEITETEKTHQITGQKNVDKDTLNTSVVNRTTNISEPPAKKRKLTDSQHVNQQILSGKDLLAGKSRVSSEDPITPAKSEPKRSNMSSSTSQSSTTTTSTPSRSDTIHSEDTVSTPTLPNPLDVPRTNNVNIGPPNTTKQEPESITLKVMKLTEGVLDKLFGISKGQPNNKMSVFENQRYLKSAKFLLDHYCSTTSQIDFENQEKIMENIIRCCAIGSIGDKTSTESLCDITMKNTAMLGSDGSDITAASRNHGQVIRSLISSIYPAPTIRGSLFLMDNFYFFKSLLEFKDVESKINSGDKEVSRSLKLKFDQKYKELLVNMASQIPSPYESMTILLTDVIFTGSQDVHRFKEDFDQKKQEFRKSFDVSKIFFQQYFVNGKGIAKSTDFSYKLVKNKAGSEILPIWFLSSLEKFEEITNNISKEDQFLSDTSSDNKKMDVSQNIDMEGMINIRRVLSGLFGPKDTKTQFDLASSKLMRIVATILVQPYYVAKNFLSVERCQDIHRLISSPTESISSSCLLELINHVKVFEALKKEDYFTFSFDDQESSEYRGAIEKCGLVSYVHLFDVLQDFITRVYAGNERPMYINSGHSEISTMSEDYSVYNGSSSTVTSNIPGTFSSLFNTKTNLTSMENDDQGENDDLLDLSCLTRAAYKFAQSGDDKDVISDTNISSGTIRLRTTAFISFFSKLTRELDILGEYIKQKSSPKTNSGLNNKSKSKKGYKNTTDKEIISDILNEDESKSNADHSEILSKGNHFKMLKLLRLSSNTDSLDIETIMSLLYSRKILEEYMTYFKSLHARVKLSIDNLRDLKLSQTAYEGFRSKPLKTTQQFTENQEKRDLFMRDSLIAIMSCPTHLEISKVLDSLALSWKAENEEEIAWAIKKPLFLTIPTKNIMKIISNITNFPIILLRDWIEKLSAESPSDSNDPVATFISLCDPTVTTNIFTSFSRYSGLYRVANLVLLHMMVESNKLMFRYLPETSVVTKSVGSRDRERRSSKVKVLESPDSVSKTPTSNKDAHSPPKKSTPRKNIDDDSEDASNDEKGDVEWSPDAEKKMSKAASKIEKSHESDDEEASGAKEDSEENEKIATADDDVDEGSDEEDVSDQSDEEEAEAEAEADDDDDDEDDE